ncbi:MAG: type II toxin-antitoxin system PemK/MazF family toxin [Nostoc sp. JL33]|nr:type II toxin-antitoxin system PemK/MazF family toxin [Nostoc sp. JL33]
MVVYRGEIWWANLPDPLAWEPGYRRPILIVQDDIFTQSRISTVIVVIITSNTQLAQAPGNVLLPHEATGLPRDSVANVSQIFTVDKTFLVERVGSLPEHLQEEIDQGLRTILYL